MTLTNNADVIAPRQMDMTLRMLSVANGGVSTVSISDTDYWVQPIADCQKIHRGTSLYRVTVEVIDESQLRRPKTAAECLTQVEGICRKICNKWHCGGDDTQYLIDATRLWNAIDHMDGDQEIEALWDTMMVFLPEVFYSHDVNSMKFAYTGQGTRHIVE